MSSLYAKGSSAVQIAEQISTQIKQGDLQPGDLLPPVRQLAVELGVNPNTVASAYAKLRDAGLVATRGRAGTLVLEQPLMAVRSPRQVPEGMRDLASGNLDAALLPALSLSADDVFPQQNGYDISGDLPALCQLAGDWLSQQGTALGETAVFSGALDAIEKALRSHAAPGASVWVEDPCWPPLLTLLRHLRLKPLPLLVDEQGCRLPEKDAAAQGCAVILTPRAQNPTGMSISAARANDWREFLAQNPGCLAIVDDFWGPLSQQPLHLPCTADNGLYVLSLSKFLSPDLRIALACGKPQLLQAMRADQYIRERWVSHILQQIAVKLWMQAQRDGLLVRAQQTYQQRRDGLAERLQALTGAPLPPGEGVHIWLPVRSEAAASQIMVQRGWLVQNGEPFRLKSGPAIRVSLANLIPAQLETLAQDLAVAMVAGAVVN
ncbi:aminotransferase class I/II-fold pyridoxal phosphate-dependent enzyme [Pseudomonas lundensis]|uniref:aminotransferase class I/II-fold pyridoxal phosphate-dependent enzyme n=1 Tax=Serratia proteamaculans TaxID=28151 RepID=UPI00298283A6|nr:aminotransferase class I/II-fold pyridoxal phosphate-dependent enzyme [Serratia proteamaculans]MDW5498345.1 aminotransferase class I/II-fold pyridoxal phosphate-dependent enzyme [Serratia proteamaculans]MDW5503403.1 aminotransferase class I/II-fold pyridoxal phosphate-dependent enzyme [Pseudomonas lundensis]